MALQVRVKDLLAQPPNNEADMPQDNLIPARLLASLGSGD
jgi:hypothetical protein